MQTVFEGKRITSVLSVIPESESLFDDEVDNYSFPPKQTMRLKKLMGYDRHRVSKPSSTVSDFASYGLTYMLENKWLEKKDIGAVVTVTLSPDHFVPHISNILHGKFDLADDVICLDIAQGCCAYLVGLMQSFMLLDHLGGKKVLLICGDVLSHKVSKNDRNDYPLVGDAASLSVIENDPSAGRIYYEIHMDGSRGDALKIPAGGFRMPCTPETAELHDLGDGNRRSLDHMCMDGSAVFNFVQTEVPPLISHMLSSTGNSTETIHRFLFHQPNKFMLQKLADKAEIPYEKLPMDIVERFGNPSGASIPLVMTEDIRDILLTEKKKYMLAAFGSGLAWGGMILDIGPLAGCGTITADL